MKTQTTKQKRKDKKMKKTKSSNRYKTHSRKYVEKLVCDFINKKQIQAYYGKDDAGIFEVRFAVKEES